MSGSTEPTRVSQVVAEALVSSGGDPVRASQIAVEMLIGTLGYVRATQLVTEALIGTLGFVRVSQLVSEGLISTLGFMRVSQCVVEVLTANYKVYMPAIYPTLVGLGYSVVKRPIWNTATGASASGRSSRAGLQVNPIYEWDLTYDLLSDGARDVLSTTQSDLRTLLGFFNSVRGGLFPFLFSDPDDCAVTGQALGTGDGATTNFTFVRTFGGTAGSTTEPVGYVNQTQPLNVYLNGVLQAPTSYAVLNANTYAQTLKFVTAPAAEAAIACDFAYYFSVFFKDDTYDFEKFAYQLWSAKKLTLRTDRA